MEARIPKLFSVASVVLGLVGLVRPAAAQRAALDTTRAHIFRGQPFRLDALTPWRRSGTIGHPVSGSSSEPAGNVPEPRFRLRAKSAPSGGFLAALADALVPVLGITSDQLHDSFGNPRKGHRHGGIDIPAPKGTPVVASVDGAVLKMKWDRGGGRTLRLVDESGRFLFYYAHLSGYARGLREGEQVRKGEIVGYVGRTGRVLGGSHLHLGIASLLGQPDRWWQARPLNPYSLLRHALGLRCDSVVASGSCDGGEPASR